MIPSWAPNVHPMIVHFAIVLVILAAAADLVRLVRPRMKGLEAAAETLYLLGALSAVSAYLSGRQAAGAVFTPGMAHSLVDDHGSWALVTTVCVTLVAVLRLGGLLMHLADTRATRLLFVALGVAVAVLVQQTAERGARLVYEQGVGVIPSRGPSDLGALDPSAVDESPR